MLVPMLCVGTLAAEPLDIRDLTEKGQKHIYVGESKIEKAPVADGQILEGEYSASEGISFNDCPESQFSDAKLHFAHDRRYIYVALEVTDHNFNASVSRYTFNINFPVSGGFADAASYLALPVTISNSNTVSIPSITFCNYNGGTARTQNFAASKLVSVMKGGHDKTTKKTVIELYISTKFLRNNFGFVVSKEMMLSLTMVSKTSVYDWCVALDNETRAAIEMAYPDKAYPKLTKAPHIVHFSDPPEKVQSYDFYTLDGASIKSLEDGNNAIRFETIFKKEYLDRLIADNPEAEVYVGTLIIEVPTALNLFNELTKEWAVSQNVKYWEIYSDVEAPIRSDDKTAVYAGSVRDIVESDKLYAAIGFVNILGSYTYSPTYTIRSASTVAVTALRDLSNVKSDAYPTEVMLNVKGNVGEVEFNDITEPAYSCYSEEALIDYYFMSGDCASGVLGHFWDVHPKYNGTLRVVSTNVYFHKINWVYPDGNEQVKLKVIKQNADFIEESQGDVILMQEVSNGYWTTGGKASNKHADYLVQDRLFPMLESLGYKMADAKVGDFPEGTSADNSEGVNYTPIWYDPETVTLEACEHVFYSSVRHNPDGRLSSSKGFTWALFTEKATGKKFIAASTHLTYHGDASIANFLRKKDASELTARLKEVSAQYGAPVIVGGDFNCRVASEPYNIIVGEYENSKDSARVLLNPQYETGHSYPSTLLPSIGNAIDHIFVTKDAFSIKLYQTMFSDKSLSSTDHIPVSIDFTIK